MPVLRTVRETFALIRLPGGRPTVMVSVTVSDADVLAIPAGMPHQFVAVSDPFLYFVVKVEA